MVLLRGLIAGLFLMSCLIFSPSFVLAGEVENMKSHPVANQNWGLDYAWDLILGVALIPLHIVLAFTYAPGEQFMKGKAYNAEYAKDGYYRTHARWWDPWFYHQET